MQDTYTFKEIPSQRPNTPLLDRIDTPGQLRELAAEQLTQLARELRAFLLWSVGQTGGHFGAGLGVLELTVALHYVFNTPEDRLVWDVGHQAYPHKILTGRRERMNSIRRKDGLAGFPKRRRANTIPSALVTPALPSALPWVWPSPLACRALVARALPSSGMVP